MGLIASLALFVLGILAKEVAIVFPLLLLLAELALWNLREPDPRRLFSTWKAGLRGGFWIFILALTVAALGLYHATFLVRATPMVEFWGGSLSTNLGTTCKLFVHYLRLVFWPHPLIVDYKGGVFSLSTGWLDPVTLLSLLILLCFMGAALWILRQQLLLSLDMFWFLAILLPVIQLIPFHEIAADHFLYLPMVGVGLGFGVLVKAGWRRPEMRPLLSVLCLVLALAGALRTVRRNRDWQDNKTLWETTYASAPNSYRANTNLGRIYFQSSDPSLRRKGIEMTQAALRLSPEDPVASANLGSMLYVSAKAKWDQSQVDEASRFTQQAIEYLERALEKRPHDGSVLSNLGNCYR